MLGAGDRSEDIAQDAILYGRAHLGQLREPSKVRPWLRTIAARAARRRPRPWLRLNDDEQLLVLHDPSLGPDASHAIAGLPRRERQAIVLVYGLGYTQDEVGTLMGISRGTVAASVWRARQKLARALREYGQESE